MKKHIIWFIALGLIVVGGIMMIAAALHGAQGVIYTKDGLELENYQTYSESLEYNDTIVEIEANIDLANISLVPASDGKLKVEYKVTDIDKPQITFIDGKLKITMPHRIPNWSINLPGTNSFNKGGNITIYYPQNTMFESIYIGNDLGNIDVKGVNTNDLIIQNDLGDVIIKDVISKSTDIELNLGNLTMSGEFSESTLLQNDLGNITVNGNLLGITDITSNLGDVALNLSGIQSDYDYLLSVDVGDIFIDGSKVKQSAYNNIHAQNNVINVKADLGNISIKFGQ